MSILKLQIDFNKYMRNFFSGYYNHIFLLCLATFGKINVRGFNFRILISVFVWEYILGLYWFAYFLFCLHFYGCKIILIMLQLIEFLSDTNELAAADVLVFVREAIQRFDQLRSLIISKLLETFPTIKAVKLVCESSWIIPHSRYILYQMFTFKLLVMYLIPASNLN